MFSALPLKPDIAEYGRHVRLVPEAGHWTGFEARARQAALSLVTIHVIQHAAAVLSVTSTSAGGQAGALLQTLAQRRPHHRPNTIPWLISNKWRESLSVWN